MSWSLRRYLRVAPFLLDIFGVLSQLETDNHTPQSTRYRHSWHLDKTISVGHLLSTIVIAVSVFSWASAVGSRVEQNAQAVIYLTKQQQENKQRIESVRGEIRTDLRVINDKLDRLIEKRLGRK